MKKKITYSFEEILFYFYILTFPLYIFKSGGMQLSDFFLILSFALLLIKKSGKLVFFKYQRQVVFLYCSLLFIIIATNFLRDISITISLFYIFNLVNIILIFQLLNIYGNRFVSILSKVAFLSMIGQLLKLILIGGFTGQRMTLSFNNPNQLGFYALLCSSITIVLYYTKNSSLRQTFLNLVASFLLISASLSSSAMIAHFFQVVFFVFILIYESDYKFKNRMLRVTVFIVVVITLNINSIISSKFYKGLETRYVGSDKKIDNLSSDRGYYRITDYPQYWIFGSGEGKYFEKFNHTSEFHSTIGNIQVSYGIISTIILLLIFTLAVHPHYIKSFPFYAVMIYGITHNGIRSGLFWLLIVLMLYSACKNEKVDFK